MRGRLARRPRAHTADTALVHPALVVAMRLVMTSTVRLGRARAAVDLGEAVGEVEGDHLMAQRQLRRAFCNASPMIALEPASGTRSLPARGPGGAVGREISRRRGAGTLFRTTRLVAARTKQVPTDFGEAAVRWKRPDPDPPPAAKAPPEPAPGTTNF